MRLFGEWPHRACHHFDKVSWRRRADSLFEEFVLWLIGYGNCTLALCPTACRRSLVHDSHKRRYLLACFLCDQNPVNTFAVPQTRFDDDPFIR